jgi:hypothetical protein
MLMTDLQDAESAARKANLREAHVDEIRHLNETLEKLANLDPVPNRPATSDEG